DAGSGAITFLWTHAGWLRLPFSNMRSLPLIPLLVLSWSGSGLGQDADAPTAPPIANPEASPAPAATSGLAPQESDASVPYAPYEGSSYPEPGPRSNPRGPLPLPEEPEFTRRSVELIPSLGLALPHCAQGEESDDRCSGVSAGLVIGLTVLWRVTPMFAWGGSVEV